MGRKIFTVRTTTHISTSDASLINLVDKKNCFKNLMYICFKRRRVVLKLPGSIRNISLDSWTSCNDSLKFKRQGNKLVSTCTEPINMSAKFRYMRCLPFVCRAAPASASCNDDHIWRSTHAFGKQQNKRHVRPILLPPTLQFWVWMHSDCVQEWHSPLEHALHHVPGYWHNSYNCTCPYNTRHS